MKKLFVILFTSTLLFGVAAISTTSLTSAQAQTIWMDIPDKYNGTFVFSDNDKIRITTYWVYYKHHKYGVPSDSRFVSYRKNIKVYDLIPFSLTSDGWNIPKYSISFYNGKVGISEGWDRPMTHKHFREIMATAY